MCCLLFVCFYAGQGYDKISNLREIMSDNSERKIEWEKE